MAAGASFSRSLARLRGGGAFSSLPNDSLPPSLFSHFYSSAQASVAASQPTHPSHAQERSRWPKWLLFLPGAITFGLGTWQIFRRQDKIRMLDYRQKRLEMEPIKVNELSPLSEKLDSLEFRKLLCQGVFDENRSVYVGPRSRSISGVTENGYYLITPLMPVLNDPESVQSPVLVNRGWVPCSWREKSTKNLQEYESFPNTKSPLEQERKQSSWWRFWSKKPKNVEGQIPVVTPVKVIGVVRGSENPSIFVPPNDPTTSQWFYVDVPAIAVACGLPQDTIYIEDINENVNPSDPYPVPKDVNALIRSSVMPQDHLNYTLTWYSLSAAVTYMAFKRLTPRKNRR